MKLTLVQVRYFGQPELFLPALTQWWSGPSLIGAIDQLDLDSQNPVSALTETEVKACVSDVWSSGSTVTASAKIELGRPTRSILYPDFRFVHCHCFLVMCRDSICWRYSHGTPSKRTSCRQMWVSSIERVSISLCCVALSCRGLPVRRCMRGDYVESVVLQLDPVHVHVGSALASRKSTLEVTNQIVCRLVVFNVDIPICSGQQVRDLHFSSNFRRRWCHISTPRFSLPRFKDYLPR